MAREASILFDYWDDDIEWFIVGGASVTDEGQTIAERYPNVKCIGFEPNPEFVRLQNGPFRFPGTVHPYALWSSNQPLILTTPVKASERSASVCRPQPGPDMGGPWIPQSSYAVAGRALDYLSDQYGPFTNAALWIDIEFAELNALRGATELLEKRQIRLINLETYAHLMLPDINRLLTRYGFLLQKVWNIGIFAGRDAQDYIYKLENV